MDISAGISVSDQVIIRKAILKEIWKTNVSQNRLVISIERINNNSTINLFL